MMMMAMAAAAAVVIFLAKLYFLTVHFLNQVQNPVGVAVERCFSHKRSLYLGYLPYDVVSLHISRDIYFPF